MARPKKNTVDYFPHSCIHGKTIFILEQKFGNDGYAFWFKLLELLGSSDGHFYDCRNVGAWEFLQAKTKMTEEQCINILNLLVNLEAIDAELWAEKIIWSDNFIKGITDVYKNRRVEIPAKPSFYTQKPLDDIVSTPENTHIKLNYIKLNKIKLDKKIQDENKIPLPEIPAEISADTFSENSNSENIENLDPSQNEITLSKNNSEELPDTSKLSPGQIKVEIAKLLDRYSDDQVEIIHQTLDAFKSIRKTYSMSDNLILIELKRWNKKPSEQIISGLQVYLEKGCAQEGKDEKHAWGIIQDAVVSPDHEPLSHQTMKKQKIQPNPDVATFLKFAGEEFQKKMDMSLNIEWGKDGKLIKNLLANRTLEYLQQLYLHALNMKDDFINSKAPLTIGVFHSCITKIEFDMKKPDNGIDEDYLQKAWNEACNKVTSDNWDKQWSDEFINQTTKQMNLYSRAHYDREPPKSLKFDFINTLKIILKQQTCSFTTKNLKEK